MVRQRWTRHTVGVALRDKVHRVDMETTSTHVVVTANGRVLADSTRPVVLRETGLPERYYLPKDDSWPHTYGLHNQKLPAGFWGQFFYPLRIRSRTPTT